MGKWATYKNRGGSGGPGWIDSYLANVRLSGGTINALGMAALQALVRQLMTEGVWSNLSEIWPCIGSDVPAMSVKLKVWPGTADSYAGHGIVGGDYTQEGATGGCTFDGAAKYLSGGPTNAMLGLTPSMFVSARSYTPGGGLRMFMGAYTGGQQFWVGSLNDAASTDTREGAASGAAVATPLAAARWASSRVSATDLQLYRNGASVATSGANIVPAGTAIDGYIGAGNSNGVPASYVAARLTGAAWGSGLTATQMAALAAAWAGFDAQLGR